MITEAKIYDTQEENWNIITHAAGVVFAPVALVILLYYAREPVQWVASILYVLSMTAMFLGSSMYHAAKDPAKRALLRKFDHSSIYFLISGTYTPVMLLCVPGIKGIIVLSLSWLITVIGVPLEILNIKPFKGFSLTLYLISGWLCIVVIKSLILNMSAAGLILLSSGGILYSLGVIFYISRRKYSHTLWHMFVIGGVILQYFAVLSLLKR